MVDRESRSVWSQLAGKAISGSMRDTPLTAIPSLQTTWGYWRRTHPDTRVTTLEGQPGRPYLYRDLEPGDRPPLGAPRGHDTSSLGLGLQIGTEAWFFPLRRLQRSATPLRLQIDGQEVVIHYHDEAMTAWAEDTEGTLLMGVLAYERGWKSFHPESQIFDGVR